MRLKRLQISINLGAYSAMLATEDFGGYIIFLFILLHLILSLSCVKINFTGVLWEDDQYA